MRDADPHPFRIPRRREPVDERPAPLVECEVAAVGIPVRTAYRLERAGILTVGQLVETRLDGLLRAGLSRTAVVGIRAAVLRSGLVPPSDWVSAQPK